MYKPKDKFDTKLSIIKSVTPQMFVRTEALLKMDIYVEQCKDEVGWFGFVTSPKPNVYLLEDVILFEQKVHATTTEISESLLASLANEILAMNDGMDKWNNMKLWGHSHVNMGVSPSGQDDSQMEFFSKSGHDFFIRVIANKKGDMKFDIYNYEIGTAYLDVPWMEFPSSDIMAKTDQISVLENQIKALRSEIANDYTNQKKVKEISIKSEIDLKVKPFSTVTPIGGRLYSYESSRYGSAYEDESGISYGSHIYNSNKLTPGFGSNGVVKEEKKTLEQVTKSLSKRGKEIIEALSMNDLYIIGCAYQFVIAKEIISEYNYEPTYNEVKEVWDYCKFAVENETKVVTR